MNDPPRMTEAQLRRARRLIRSLCANCNGGNCLLLDDGYEPCPCPQMLTCSVLCRYFRAAVLPADRELQAEIMADSRRRCRECRRPLSPRRKIPYTARSAPHEGPAAASASGRPGTRADLRKSGR